MQSAVRFVETRLNEWEKCDLSEVGGCYWVRGRPLWYRIYRWLHFLIQLVVLVTSIFDLFRSCIEDFLQFCDPKPLIFYLKWPIYFTHWGLLLNFVQSLMGVQVLYSDKEWLKATYWIANTTAITTSLFISIFYWTFLHNPAYDTVDFLTFASHAVNSISMVIDFILVRHTFRMKDYQYVFFFGSLYTLLNISYYLAGGVDRWTIYRYIYYVLDWSNPLLATSYYVFTISLTFTVHVFMWLAFLLKRKIHLLLQQ